MLVSWVMDGQTQPGSTAHAPQSRPAANPAPPTPQNSAYPHQPSPLPYYISIPRRPVSVVDLSCTYRGHRSLYTTQGTPASFDPSLCLSLGAP